MSANARLSEKPRARAFALRLAVLTVLWWILTDGSGGWAFGVPAAVLITTFSLWQAPPAQLSLRASALPGFALFFVRQSLSAGWDVARRTLSRDMALAPELLRIPVSLPAGAPTWWLMATISLLPGTLSARIDDGNIEIHCLDARTDVTAEVCAAQRRIAVLFGLPADVEATR